MPTLPLETLRVPCPYCHVGAATVPMVRKGDTCQIEGIRDPRKCDMCGRYFGLRPKVTLEGVPLEDSRYGR